MSREADSQWYLANRADLAKRYGGAWLVVLGKTVIETFSSEEEAVEFSVTRYGINQASIFQAVLQDPFMFA